MDSVSTSWLLWSACGLFSTILFYPPPSLFVHFHPVQVGGRPRCWKCTTLGDEIKRLQGENLSLHDELLSVRLASEDRAAKLEAELEKSSFEVKRW